jgi:hypothetical protein
MWLLCIVGVERASDMASDRRVAVVRRVGVGRADDRGVGTRRCRGSALAAAGGTVSHAICASRADGYQPYHPRGAAEPAVSGWGGRGHESWRNTRVSQCMAGGARSHIEHSLMASIRIPDFSVGGIDCDD